MGRIGRLITQNFFLTNNVLKPRGEKLRFWGLHSLTHKPQHASIVSYQTAIHLSSLAALRKQVIVKTNFV